MDRGGNAGRPGPFRPGSHKTRKTRASPSRPAHFMRAANTSLLFFL